MFPWRKILGLGASVLVLANLYYYFQTFDNVLQHPVSNPTQSVPDAFSRNITITRYNQAGHVHSQLNTPKLRVYSKQQIALIDLPVIHFNETDHVWNIQARRAKYYLDSENMDFMDDVIVQQPATEQQQATRCQTEFLQFDSRHAWARTSKPVLITRNEITLSGIGMELDLNGSIMTLSHEVSFEYVPSPKKI